MAKYKVPPLKPITFKARPCKTHALDWSCDGELVVAGDDSLHVFLPHYRNPSSTENDEIDSESEKQGPDSNSSIREQFYSSPLRLVIPRQLDPRMNLRLLEGNKRNVQDQNAKTPFMGYGVGVVTGFGSALNQVMSVEWSPTGMGPNHRPILTAGLTKGAIIAWGEAIPPRNANVDLFDTRSRGFRFWKTLWGIGANMPLPNAGSPTGVSTVGDRITSYSWARQISADGLGLIAYMTDTRELVIMAIQRLEKDETLEAMWQIDEVYRHHVAGPHPLVDLHDPDFTPSSSSRSLKWSPWLSTGKDHLSKTAALAYLAPHYMGVLQITITAPWTCGNVPTIQVSDGDVVSICCHLAPDAFIEWEDAIWTSGESRICRGIITTPFTIKAFQVDLKAPSFLPTMPHDLITCNVTYPSPEDKSFGYNPITGVIMHPPDFSRKNPVPIYSLVRLSATSCNDGWFQHNMPLRDMYHDKLMPNWADYIERRTSLQMPEVIAYDTVDPGSSSDEEEDDDDDFDLPEDAGEQANPWRIRIWGATASPGGGSVAVLVTEHDAIRPDRLCRVKVVFGWTPRDKAWVEEDISPHWDKLTAEGKAWEWMYGAGPEMDGFPVNLGEPKLFDMFKAALSDQGCPLCRTQLQLVGKDFACSNNHGFARCCASGLPILRPKISRVCGICGSKNILVKELEKIARDLYGRDVELGISADLCSACGGKYIV